jgi:hypothetical protein
LCLCGEGGLELEAGEAGGEVVEVCCGDEGLRERAWLVYMLIKSSVKSEGEEDWEETTGSRNEMEWKKSNWGFIGTGRKRRTKLETHRLAHEILAFDAL